MSYLSVENLGVEGLRRVVDLGLAVKSDRDSYRTALAGKSLGLLFMKPSLRTWVSCDIGAAELGMHSTLISNDMTGFGTREAPEDVGRVLDRYVDALAMRVFDHDDLTLLDSVMDAPVINLLSDLEHPCQAAADVITIAEKAPVTDVTVAFVGDGNNVAHSLMLAVTMLGGVINVASPAGYEPSRVVIEACAAYPGSVAVTNDPSRAVAGADVVYTDVWASMGQEGEASERKNRFEGFQVNEELFGLAADDAIFMHCLPAHRGEEVTDGVVDHDRSRVLDQAENRLHSFKAVLLHLFE